MVALHRRHLSRRFQNNERKKRQEREESPQEVRWNDTFPYHKLTLFRALSPFKSVLFFSFCCHCLHGLQFEFAIGLCRFKHILMSYFLINFLVDLVGILRAESPKESIRS